MSASEEECPVCREKIQNPSQLSPCCGKVICQRCLSQSFRYRPHCPHCRSSIDNRDYANNTFLRPGRRRHLQPILPGDFQTFNSRRPVSANTQTLLGQLRDSQEPQEDAIAQASLPNQAAPQPAPQNQAPFPLIFSARPVPMPRIRPPPPPAAPQLAPVNAAPTGLIQVLPPPAPAPLPLNPAPSQDNVQAALDAWPWQTEITLMEMNPQPQGLTVRTFVCPYCQDDGLDELDLRDHCNEHHANDSRRVVCPVCVQTAHGDPQYYSRNFIRHLNLRHCFYLDDLTNLNQTDEMNIQCAILASYRENF